MAKVLDAREDLERLRAHPAGVQGEHELAGFRRGHPGLVADAPDAQARTTNGPSTTPPGDRVRTAHRAASTG